MPLLHDPAAAAWFARLDPAEAGPPCDTLTRVAVALRSAVIDRWCRAWLGGEPRGVLVELGVGLGTRHLRLQLGPDRFLGVDFPPVLAARRRLAGGAPEDDTLAADVIDPAWRGPLTQRLAGRSACFVAEGLLPFLPADQVPRLLAGLAAEHPGSPLLFDAYAPLARSLQRLHPGLRRAATPVRWTLVPHAPPATLTLRDAVTLTDDVATLRRLPMSCSVLLHAWPGPAPWSVHHGTLRTTGGTTPRRSRGRIPAVESRPAPFYDPPP